MAANWDKEVDTLVIGSGAGGLLSALVAALPKTVDVRCQPADAQKIVASGFTRAQAIETAATDHGLRITRTGGPEVIEWVDVDLPPPGPGEVRMRHHAVGLNYIDTYHRSGVYPVELPAGLGSEAAGVVEAVGEDVEGLSVGDRVGTFGPSRGAYATARNVAAKQLFRLPDDVDDRTAAAMLLKGCTVEALVDRCARVQPGQTVLVWAAAGGVGQLMTGWLKAIGATVIGTAGTQAKADLQSIKKTIKAMEQRLSALETSP